MELYINFVRATFPVGSAILYTNAVSHLGFERPSLSPPL